MILWLQLIDCLVTIFAKPSSAVFNESSAYTASQTIYSSQQTKGHFNILKPGLNERRSTLQTTFSNVSSWTKMLEFWRQITVEVGCYRSKWQWVDIGSDNGLGHIRRQAIPWTNVDPDDWRHMVLIQDTEISTCPNMKPSIVSYVGNSTRHRPLRILFFTGWADMYTKDPTCIIGRGRHLNNVETTCAITRTYLQDVISFVVFEHCANYFSYTTRNTKYSRYVFVILENYILLFGSKFIKICYCSVFHTTNISHPELYRRVVVPGSTAHAHTMQTVPFAL